MESTIKDGCVPIRCSCLVSLWGDWCRTISGLSVTTLQRTSLSPTSEQGMGVGMFWMMIWTT